MTYDPTRDEPRYTEREMRNIIDEVLAAAVPRLIAAVFESLAARPLEVFGGWEPDRVYPPHSLVYHGGEQWLALASTTGEPGRNGTWSRINPAPPRAA